MAREGSIRHGLRVGDVMDRGPDLLGDGVNVEAPWRASPRKCDAKQPALSA